MPRRWDADGWVGPGIHRPERTCTCPCCCVPGAPRRRFHRSPCWRVGALAAALRRPDSPRGSSGRTICCCPPTDNTKGRRHLDRGGHRGRSDQPRGRRDRRQRQYDRPSPTISRTRRPRCGWWAVSLWIVPMSWRACLRRSSPPTKTGPFADPAAAIALGNRTPTSGPATRSRSTGRTVSGVTVGVAPTGRCRSVTTRTSSTAWCRGRSWLRRCRRSAGKIWQASGRRDRSAA